MSSNNTLARDFIKNFNAKDRKRDDNSNSSSSDSDVNYQKHHLSKLQTIIQKTTRKVPSSGHRSHYVCPYGGPRAPSFLEQQLFPGIRIADAASLFPSNKSDDGQLTIFYKGAVNVYDDISFDKARAIMLMASAKGTPHVPEPTKESNPSALYIPIATKRSLRLFFDKRRDRRINKIPDASMAK